MKREKPMQAWEREREAGVEREKRVNVVNSSVKKLNWCTCVVF
jgi:hypothetical protein